MMPTVCSRLLGKMSYCHYVTSSTPRMIVLFVSFCLLVSVSLFYIPLRNVVFKFHINKAWRNVSTADIIKMHYIREPPPQGVHDVVACDVMQTPTFRRDDVNRSRIHVHRPSYDTNLVFDALSKSHGRYLPVLNVEGIVDYLYLFMAMREVLDRRNIPFFMTAGSILGATRHGGFVPWDDDLDIGIHINYWEDVKQSLSCVEGFKLEIFGNVHWKFHFDNSSFPFIDIFFYSQHGPYLWAMTSYISKTFIYREEMVFPLVEIDFEGMSMPMPGQGLEIVRRIYDFSQCVTYNGHIEVKRSWLGTFPDAYSKTKVPCRDLSYMYRMMNLDSGCEATGEC